MSPMQSSVRKHLLGRHCLLPQTSLLLLPQRESEKEREKTHASAIHTAVAQEQMSKQAFSCSHRQSVKRFCFFLARLFVFSFSIGMSTTQTRGTLTTYVRQKVVAGNWGL